MFDHLVKKRSGSKHRSIGFWEHAMVFVLVLTVVTSATLAIAWLSVLNVSALQKQVQPSIAVRIIDDGGGPSAVGPLTLWPIATIEAEVTRASVELPHIRFLLNGAYDRGALSDVDLFFDDAQIGYSVLPDADGYVDFPTNGVALAPGKHRFVIKVTTYPGGSVSAMQVVFDPQTSFGFNSGGREVAFLMQLPYATSMLNLVQHGTIGSFIKNYDVVANASGKTESRFYLYGEAEDFKLQSLTFKAKQNLTGARIDIFQDAQFITSAPFDGTEAVALLSEPIIRILRGKNSILRLLLAEVPTDLYTSTPIYLNHVEALGLTSKQQIVTTQTMQVL